MSLVFINTLRYGLSIFALILCISEIAFAATSKCTTDCVTVKSTVLNGERELRDAFGHYVNLTTTLETNGYEIKRVFIQRNNLRADYRSCEKKSNDLVCSFPAFNLFYGRKPDAKEGDLLTYNIRALGEHKETGEAKLFKDSFSLRYFSNNGRSSVKTYHAKKGLIYVQQDSSSLSAETSDLENIKSFKGKIVDATTKQPLEDVTVRIFPITPVGKGSKLDVVKSDSNGNFALQDSAPKSFSLYVEADGYKPFSSGVLSEVETIKLQLEPVLTAINSTEISREVDSKPAIKRLQNKHEESVMTRVSLSSK